MKRKILKPQNITPADIQPVNKKFTKYFAIPFYPLLLSIYVPIWLVSNNVDLFPLSDAFRALTVSLLLAILSFSIFYLIYRSAHKAAFLTAMSFVCIYGFTPLWHAFLILGVHPPAIIAGVVLAVAFPTIAMIVFWLPAIRETASKVLNGFAIALLVLPVGTIAKSEFYHPADRTHDYVHPAFAELPTKSRPSVVHIVLDAYSRADTLKHLYDYDNSVLIESLRQLGFRVADQATSPYNQTMLSLYSVFSMGYMNEKMAALSESGKSNKEIRIDLHRDFQTAPVLRRFRSMGYKIIEIEDMYRGTQLEDPDVLLSNSQARFGASHFETVLAKYTPIKKVIDRLDLLDARFDMVKFSLESHNFDEFDVPYFIYNHVIAPHPPFNISWNGAFRVNGGGMSEGQDRTGKVLSDYRSYRDGYIEKLRYVNKKVLEKARDLIASVPDPKIIVIHGDHGGGLYYDQESIARTCLRERFTTLLAVYSSAGMPVLEIDDETNLVNLYREIFTQAFGMAYDRLPSRHYHATWTDPGNPTPVPGDALKEFSPVCAPDGIR